MSFSIRPYHIDAHACAEVYFHVVQRGTHEKYTEAQRNAWAPKIPAPLTYLADETCVISEAKSKVIGLGRACLGIFMGGLTEGLKQRA